MYWLPLSEYFIVFVTRVTFYSFRLFPNTYKFIFFYSIVYLPKKEQFATCWTSLIQNTIKIPVFWSPHKPEEITTFILKWSCDLFSVIFPCTPECGSATVLGNRSSLISTFFHVLPLLLLVIRQLENTHKQFNIVRTSDSIRISSTSAYGHSRPGDSGSHESADNNGLILWHNG